MALATAAVTGPAGAQVTASGNFGATGWAVVPFSTSGGVVDLRFISGYGDPTFSVFDGTGTHVISNDDANGSLNSRITRNLAAGSYTLLVSYCCNSIYGYALAQGGTSATSDGFNSGSYVIGGGGTLSGMEGFLDGISSPSAANAAYSLTISNASLNSATLAFNPSGVGHILYVPYFSTQSGNVTALSIVNTDIVNGKVLKVRFRGASNSDDVYDFQVFLSPGDVWTAGISQGDEGRSRLDTVDKSCTLPANVNGRFITSRTAGPAAADRPAETREGYIEILTMADIVPGDPKSKQLELFNATKHVGGVAPCTSSVLTALTHENASEYMAAPTTGLMANWTIINVQRIVAYSGAATAIEARGSAGLPDTGRLVYWDQRPTPLTAAEANVNTADPLLRGATPVIAGARYDLPDLSTPYLAGIDLCPFCQARALSDAITAEEVAAEFYSEPSVGAQTDWVISFPTRRYFAAVKYGATPTAVYNKTSDGNIYFTSDNTEMGSAGNGGKAWQLCSKLGVQAAAFFDREETTTVVDDIVISPGTPTQLSICGEVTTVGINNDTAANSATFGAVARTNMSNGFRQGWGSLTVPSENGLPMLVRQFMRVNNTQTNVFYGLSFPARVMFWGNPPPYVP